MDYIRFSVDGQRLDYDRKYYSSTDTIDTLYCNFKFETDDLGHILGGWDLPYLWAQFHDEEGNVYIKAVEDNVCSIPHKCLRQLKFKMTLFATDKEDYMTCEKRYTTNEIAFKFKGRANINYDGGVSPDEPVPTQWQLLLDRVDECESDVDRLSQYVSAMESTVMDDRVDELGTGLANESTARANADAELQTAIQTEANTRSEAINNVNSTVNELNTSLAEESATRDSADTRLEKLINDESTARASGDADLQALIGDRYTKAQTDTLIGNEATARSSADENLQSLINDEVTARENADSDLQSLIDGINTTVNGLDTRLANESTARTNADARLEGLVGDEKTARENADANLQSLINDRYTKTETDALVNVKQDKLNDSQLAAVNSGLTSSDKTTLDGLDGRVTTNTNDIAALDEQVEELKKASGGGIDGVGAGFHSSIYRGKYLGSRYTDEQKEAIASGSFDDLFIGDYWEINGVKWRIADFDYYYNVGDTPFTKHHVIIVPDTAIGYTSYFKRSNTTVGGYKNSSLATNIDNYFRYFFNAFGESFISAHKCLYSNAVTDGITSGSEWVNTRVGLMSEEEVYGHAIWGVGNGYDTGTQKTQFRLFALDKTKISIGNEYWLSNVCSGNNFCSVGSKGDPTNNGASTELSVRPFACLVGA